MTAPKAFSRKALRLRLWVIEAAEAGALMNLSLAFEHLGRRALLLPEGLVALDEDAVGDGDDAGLAVADHRDGDVGRLAVARALEVDRHLLAVVLDGAGEGARRRGERVASWPCRGSRWPAARRRRRSTSARRAGVGVDGAAPVPPGRGGLGLRAGGGAEADRERAGERDHAGGHGLHGSPLVVWVRPRWAAECRHRSAGAHPSARPTGARTTGRPHLSGPRRDAAPWQPGPVAAGRRTSYHRGN